jgi:hypothetical protein
VKFYYTPIGVFHAVIKGFHMSKCIIHFQVVCTLALAACASQQKPELLSQLKKVAIVNLASANQMESGGTGGANNGIGGTISGIRAIKSLANGSADAQLRARMEAIYDTLTQELQKTGVAVASRDEVAANRDFIDLYRKSSRLDDPGTFVVKGAVLNLRQMSEREQILDALRVDALVTAEVNFQTGKTGGASVGGFGALKRYPQAVVTLAVYDRVNRNPIWVSYRVRGEPAHDGLQETMGVADTKDPNPLFVETATSAFDRTIANYQQAQQVAAAN